MERKIIAFIILVWNLTVLSVSHSQVPKLLNYQGKLTDSNGQLLNGNYFIRFSIYNQETGGTALYYEDLQVEVENGIYNILLGGVNPIDIEMYILRVAGGVSHGPLGVFDPDIALVL